MWILKFLPWKLNTRPESALEIFYSSDKNNINFHLKKIDSDAIVIVVLKGNGYRKLRLLILPGHKLVHPAYQSMLGHIRSGTLDRFKDAFHKALNRGDEFSVAAYDCTESFTSLFDEGCAVTWCKTIDKASKVFLEMHYNRHKRLTNDIA
ncbi:unnamed protein product [Camellia sinensis]